MVKFPESFKVTESVFEIIDFQRVLTEGLTTFRNLVGFYEAATPQTHLDQSLVLFFDRVFSKYPAPLIYSSLTDYSGAVGQWTPEDVELATRLAERGWFVFGKEKVDALETFSEGVAEPTEDVKGICRLVFRGLTYGYLFLHFRDIGLVAYPHDHEGFGFAATKGTEGERAARKFLGEIENDSIYESTIVSF